MIKNFLIFFVILSLAFFYCAKQSPKEHFKKGTTLYTEGRYDEAIAEYQKAIKADSTYLKAYINLGAIYFKKKMYEEASSQFETVLRYQPYHMKAHYNLGLIQLELGKKDEAKKHYEYLKSVRSNLADNLWDRIQKK